MLHYNFPRCISSQLAISMDFSLVFSTSPQEQWKEEEKDYLHLWVISPADRSSGRSGISWKFSIQIAFPIFSSSMLRNIANLLEPRCSDSDASVRISFLGYSERSRSRPELDTACSTRSFLVSDFGIMSMCPMAFPQPHTSFALMTEIYMTTSPPEHGNFPWPP